jgi:hypothetical protein
VANIEHLTMEIEKLSNAGRQEITNRLFEKMSSDEIIRFFEKLKDIMELFGLLEIKGTALS